MFFMTFSPRTTADIPCPYADHKRWPPRLHEWVNPRQNHLATIGTTKSDFFISMAEWWVTARTVGAEWINADHKYFMLLVALHGALWNKNNKTGFNRDATAQNVLDALIKYIGQLYVVIVIYSLSLAAYAHTEAKVNYHLFNHHS
jgi:hypothetical protein